MARPLHGVGIHPCRQACLIRDTGWRAFSIWEHSSTIKDLYARRCRLEVPEMTSHAQAAELLAPRVVPGDSLLDVGCGSGYFYHSLRSRGIPAAYHGVDASPSLIEIGQRHLPAYGLPPDRLRQLRIEDLEAEVDHVVCINVLSNIDNYHRPLERMLLSARKSVIIRESLARSSTYSYVEDRFLDEGANLRVHVNTYAVEEMIEFIESYGFRAEAIEDRRTRGEPELVIGYPHHWTFLVAERAA